MVKLWPLLLLVACRPDFGARQSVISSERVLAVRGEPAEVRPNTSATWTPLIVGPSGTVATPSVDWAFCVAPKPLDENNTVADACLGGGDALVGIAAASPSASAIIPYDACQRFGPDPPPVMVGEPPLRPRDPDVTGGYYQPVRLTVDGQVSFELERIRCNLASAGAEIALQFAATYTPNQNPTLLPITVAISDGGAVSLDGIPAGARVTFTAAWDATSVESFPVYNIADQTLDMHRESMRVSWFGTDGSFDQDRTGRDETDMDTTTSNDWTAPTSPGPVFLWMVLRDSRGGVDWRAVTATVVAQ